MADNVLFTQRQDKWQTVYYSHRDRTNGRQCIIHTETGQMADSVLFTQRQDKWQTVYYSHRDRTNGRQCIIHTETGQMAVYSHRQVGQKHKCTHTHKGRTKEIQCTQKELWDKNASVITHRRVG